MAINIFFRDSAVFAEQSSSRVKIVDFEWILSTLGISKISHGYYEVWYCNFDIGNLEYLNTDIIPNIFNYCRSESIFQPAGSSVKHRAKLG